MEVAAQLVQQLVSGLVGQTQTIRDITTPLRSTQPTRKLPTVREHQYPTIEQVKKHTMTVVKGIIAAEKYSKDSVKEREYLRVAVAGTWRFLVVFR